MNSDDETRVMPIPDEIRSLMMGGALTPDAETPCVGVPSVGDTHFGETQLALARVELRANTLPISPASARPRMPQASFPSSSKAPPFSPTSKAWVSRVPRPVALALGASVGVGAALLLGLLKNGQPEARSAGAKSVQVEALVQTEDGTGLPDVPVRVRNQVVLTDESGRAPFPPILLRAPLSVKAECPNGFSGGRLVREIPESVAAASSLWSFRLVCRPEFSEVSIVIETTGCGEMSVWVDDVASGITTGGSLTLSHRVQSEEVVEVRAEPTSGRCDFEKVRHATLSATEKVTRVLFEGTILRPPVRGRVKTPAAPARPYRL